MASRVLRPEAFRLLPSTWFLSKPNNAGAANAVKPLTPLEASEGTPEMLAICSPKPLALSPNKKPSNFPPCVPNDCTPDSLLSRPDKLFTILLSTLSSLMALSKLSAPCGVVDLLNTPDNKVGNTAPNAFEAIPSSKPNKEPALESRIGVNDDLAKSNKFTDMIYPFRNIRITKTIERSTFHANDGHECVHNTHKLQ